MRAEFGSWIAAHRERYLADLADLVAIDTRSPHERRAFGWLRDYFAAHGATVAEQPSHPDLDQHPDANHNAYRTLPDRANLVAEFDRELAHRTVFSAHVDVVPPGPDFADPFTMSTVDGWVTGRGTADTKGNIVMLAAARAFLADAGVVPRRGATVDLVIEEEIGGNGALSSVLYGSDAAEVVVLEPTGLEVLHGHRGCLEFTAEFRGRSSHMGGDGISAIDGAVAFIGLVKELEARLIEEAAADPDFAGWARPVQLNVGAIEGGEWHGSIPERCAVRCSFGFHPRYPLAEVRLMIEKLVAALPEPWPAGSVSLSYPGIHNGAYRVDPDVPVARELRAAVRAAGARVPERRAWSVSCDARLYARILGVPTVIFGAGRLEHAHSSVERLDIGEWTRGVAALAGFLAGAS
jgi:acetylornithine deacetylase